MRRDDTKLVISHRPLILVVIQVNHPRHIAFQHSWQCTWITLASMMIGKALLSGLWVCPECRSLAVIFTLDHVSLFSFTAVVLLHFRCDPALSVFASKCQGEGHAVKAALCDLGDPGWGDPWFLHWAVLLPTPSELAPGVFVAFLVFCFLLRASVIMAHKMSLCMHRDDTKLSPLAFIDFSPINWYLSRHCSLVCVVFGCLFLVLCVCVVFVFGVFLFGFLFLWFLVFCFVSWVSLTVHGPASTWHKRCHFACNEMILSYHLQLIFSLINWNCHVTALCFVLFWCGLCFLVCFCAFCFPLFLWCLALFPGWAWQCIGLCIGPPPVYFCGHYSNGLCVN